MKTHRAVTLVEVLIVVLILGALAAIAIPRLAASAANAKRRACAANVERINSQIELYNHDTGSWPLALSNVIEDVSYFGDDEVECPFGQAYVLNDSTHRVIFHDHGDGGFVPVAGGDGGGGGGDGDDEDGEGGQGGQGGNHGDNGNHGEGDNGNHGEGDNGNHYGQLKH